MESEKKGEQREPSALDVVLRAPPSSPTKRRRRHRGGVAVRRRREQQQQQQQREAPSERAAPWFCTLPVYSMAVGVSTAFELALLHYGPQRWGVWMVQAGGAARWGVEVHLTRQVISVRRTPHGAPALCTWVTAADDDDNRREEDGPPVMSVADSAALPCGEVQQALADVAHALGAPGAEWAGGAWARPPEATAWY